MKFTKEEAYKELVAKLTEGGENLNLSERSINEFLENLMPLVANEETELSEFVEKTFPLFKTSDTNVRNDVSVGITTYKKNNPKKETKKDPKEDAKNEEMAAILQRMEEMERKLQENDSKEKIKGYRSEFIAKAKEKGVKSDTWIEDYLAEITIGEDFDVDAKVESCLKFYNKTIADVQSDVSPKGSSGSGSDKTLEGFIKNAKALAFSQGLT